VLLSRDLAAMGQYPAVDISVSISRLASKLLTNDRKDLVQKFRRLHAVYEENKDLISVGAYRAGTNPELDEAMQRREVMRNFLRQGTEQQVTIDESFALLAQILS